MFGDRLCQISGCWEEATRCIYFDHNGPIALYHKGLNYYCEGHAFIEMGKVCAIVWNKCPNCGCMHSGVDDENTKGK